MAKLAIIGTVRAMPGRRNDLLPLLTAHRDRCLKDEPGTLQFEIFAARENETDVLLYELYRDDAAFESHRTGASFTRWRAETVEMVATIFGTRNTLIE